MQCGVDGVPPGRRPEEQERLLPVVLVEPELRAGDLQGRVEDPGERVGVDEELGALAEQDGAVDHVGLQAEEERISQHHVERDVSSEEVDGDRDVVTREPQQAEIVEVRLE